MTARAITRLRCRSCRKASRVRMRRARLGREIDEFTRFDPPQPNPLPKEGPKGEREHTEFGLRLSTHTTNRSYTRLDRRLPRPASYVGSSLPKLTLGRLLIFERTRCIPSPLWGPFGESVRVRGTDRVRSNRPNEVPHIPSALSN